MVKHHLNNPLLDTQNPWPGLKAFTETNSDFFFGREREIHELNHAVSNNTLTVLFGKSGLGKSSLLQAGLSPQLRKQHYVPVYIRLNHFEETLPLEDQVEVCLEQAIERYQLDAPKPIREETLWEYFHKQNNDWWSQENELLKPVLIFDQFEEIITAGQQNSVRAKRCNQFLEELEDLIENRPPKALLERFSKEKGLAKKYDLERLDYRVIISLREDYLADFEGLRERLRPIMSNRIRLLPLDDKQAKEVVLKPGAHLVDGQVAQQLIDYVAGHSSNAFQSGTGTQAKYVEPALLCVILRELNNQRIANKQAKISAELLEQKRPESIMHDFYRKGLAGMPDFVRDFIQENLLTASGARNRISEDDALQRYGLSQDIIATLVDRRILQRDRIANISWLELTHDTLVPVVRFHAEVARRRQMFKRRLTYSGIGTALAVFVLVVALFVQFQIQEQQTLSAAKVAVSLSDTLRDSQSVSYQQREKFAQTLNEQLNQHVADVPDSDLVKAEYLHFLLNQAETYSSQSRRGKFAAVVEQALSVYQKLDPSALSKEKYAQLTIQLKAHHAQMALLTEDFELANTELDEAERMLVSLPVETPLWPLIWQAKLTYLRAKILDDRFDIVAANRQFQLAVEQIQQLFSSEAYAALNEQHLDEMNVELAQGLRQLYHLLFVSLEELQGFDNYSEVDHQNIADQYNVHLADAKKLFGDEYADLWQLYQAKGLNIQSQAKVHEVKPNIARTLVDSSINTIQELVQRHPDNLTFYYELLTKLNDRIELTISTDKRQLVSDLTTYVQLVHYLLRADFHPSSLCKVSLNASYWALRYESTQKEPNYKQYYSEGIASAHYCESEAQLASYAASAKVLMHYYKMASMLKHKEVAEQLDSIKQLREDAFESLRVLQARGASEEFIANRTMWLFTTTNDYMNAVTDEERLAFLNQSLSVIDSLTPQMIAANSGNLSWFMSSLAIHYLNTDQPDKALAEFGRQVDFGVDNMYAQDKTLITNTIWALTQQVKMVADYPELDAISQADKQADSLIEALTASALLQNVDIKQDVYRYWQHIAKELQKVIEPEEALSISQEQLLKAMALHNKAREFEAVILKEVPEQSTTQSRDINFQTLHLDQLARQEDGNYQSEMALGWQSRALFNSPDAITVLPSDPMINPDLIAAEENAELLLVRFTHLTFYSQCRLVLAEYNNDQNEVFNRYFLENEQTSELHQLNGYYNPIYDANESCGIRLDSRTNAAAYLRFFYALVNGKEFPRPIIESADDLIWFDDVLYSEKSRIQEIIRPLYVWETAKQDAWSATATIHYGTALYHVEIAASQDGKVDMKGNRRIAKDLKVHPLTRSQKVVVPVSIAQLETLPKGWTMNKLLTHYTSMSQADQRRFHAILEMVASAYKSSGKEQYSHEPRADLVTLFLTSGLYKAQDPVFKQLRFEVFDPLCQDIAKSEKMSLTSLSFCSLFTGEFEQALEYSTQDEQLNPENLAGIMNKGHALMFLGKTKEAMALYRKHLNKPIAKKDWNYYVQEDFDRLEKVGLTHPLMQKARDMFAEHE